MATAGVGSVSGHMAGELFNMYDWRKNGSRPVSWVNDGDNRSHQWPGASHVRTAPHATIEYISAGRLRPLAVTTATRSEALPEIPTMSESRARL